MSDTPKFTVIDRRKYRADEEHESTTPEPAPPEAAAPAPESAPPHPASSPAPTPASDHPGPRLVIAEPPHLAGPEQTALDPEEEEELYAEIPPPPTAQESNEQKSAYDASAQRIEDLVRAQNPAIGAQQPVGFEHLVQQFYLSAMIQMGAGTQEGQRPRVDILGARQTIDILGILAEKTHGNLTEKEDSMLQTVLYETRMTFLELTRMITLQGMQPPQPPPPGKR
jgi:hypothetical protein